MTTRPSPAAAALAGRSANMRQSRPLLGRFVRRHAVGARRLLPGAADPWCSMV